jgi:putative transcriptional regulator
MSAAAVEAAAARDCAAPPLTETDFARMQRATRTKTLRRALGLTQEEFAARHHIPFKKTLGTLRDWEQGRTEPDQPARAYLTVIARDPEGAAGCANTRKVKNEIRACGLRRKFLFCSSFSKRPAGCFFPFEPSLWRDSTRPASLRSRRFWRHYDTMRQGGMAMSRHAETVPDRLSHRQLPSS